jgi:hypothetical protein
MKDEIIEEMLVSIIKRLDILEKKPIQTQHQNHIQNKASEKQISYLKSLGGIITPNMTKEEARRNIDLILAKREIPKKTEYNEVTEEDYI